MKSDKPQEAKKPQMTQEEADDQLINAAFQQLLDSYLNSNHRKKVDIITKAFNFARQAHKGVRRLSGEPYIMHPIAVAMIASQEMGLGSTSICSALLHDVVEDTDFTVEDIANIFGAKIAQIVDGLTKISGGIFGEQASAQAENFKKLLLTMSDDIRVILIKICDRLHNMRTLESQPPSKQYKIAGETLYIYAPLANRLGLNKIKSELENLSFHFEHPETYADIVQRLEATEKQRREIFDEFTAPIREQLDAMGLQSYEIKERVKTPYSIWQKMQNKHVTFDEIYDILAARIIFTPQKREDEVNDCFQIYVALSKIYKSHPDRLRDWINHPKANGYQALHVTLMSHRGQWIEVQIRSDRMDEIAEQGFAAHWKYKEEGTLPEQKPSADDKNAENENELNDWLSTIKEILDDPQPDAMDFLDAIKLNLFASEIFVFTPKGEIKTMPAGSTALDFAFSIHTFLGSHCIGAKVNHTLVPMSHKLQSGDQVEILISKSQHPKAEWMTFASTAKAKAKIQAILRREARELQKQGEEKLRKFCNDNELEMTSALIDHLATTHDFEKRDQFFQALGTNAILLGQKDLDSLSGKTERRGRRGWLRFVPFVGKKKKEEEKQELFIATKELNRKKPIYITEENYAKFKHPDCCHPIPGDDILGFIDNQQRVEIHRRSCEVASRLKSSYGNRLLDLRWDMHKQLYFDATIHVQGIDRIGLLNEVTSIISRQMNVNIRHISINCEEELFEGTIDLRVHDREDVKTITTALKKVEGLKEVSTIK